MGTLVITFRSVTPAQRADRVLRGVGLRCYLGRTPRWMEEQGCGYSLRVRCQDAVAAVELLRKNQISYRKLYLRRENGSVEEMAL